MAAAAEAAATAARPPAEQEADSCNPSHYPALPNTCSIAIPVLTIAFTVVCEAIEAAAAAEAAATAARTSAEADPCALHAPRTCSLVTSPPFPCVLNLSVLGPRGGGDVCGAARCAGGRGGLGCDAAR